jgi:chromate transporter
LDRSNTPRLIEVFWVALRLGLTSFGGPIAHLGYFERVYVRERGWLQHAELTELIALCQVLPGPTSSQVGFLIGERRGGLAGAALAWIGFTLPSAVLMMGYALWAPHVPAAALAPLLQGLKWVAVMVVAQAVWQMALRLCSTWRRGAIAAMAALALLLPGNIIPALLLLAGAAAGVTMLHRESSDPPGTGPVTVSPSAPHRGALAFVAFSVLLLLSFVTSRPRLLALAALLYGAGAAVFGGGHVVLPLLHEALVPSHWLSEDQFLSGYGAAQALPGPLFSFAAFVGASAAPSGPAMLATAAGWAGVALVSLFLPGLLLAFAAVWLWSQLRHHALAQAALAGINAAVVGILAAALIRPVMVSAIHDIFGAGLCLLGALALQRWQIAPILIVLLSVAVSYGAAALA